MNTTIEVDDLTPIKAIRHYCLECKNYNVENLSNGNDISCPLQDYRNGNYKEYKESPIEGIKNQCQDCTKNKCSSCNLYPFNL